MTVPLRAGTVGVILMIHSSQPPVYEVEFVDETGISLGTYTVEGEDIDVPRPSVRKADAPEE
jgi:hypothetical protein